MESMHKRILVTIIIGAVLVLSFYFITNAITKYTGFSISRDNGNDFEICLKEQDVVLYVNTNQIATTLKDIELFDYLQHFEIMNCLINNQVCLDNGVNSFPTWIINDNKINKDINFQKLKEISGCVESVE